MSKVEGTENDLVICLDYTHNITSYKRLCSVPCIPGTHIEIVSCGGYLKELSWVSLMTLIIQNLLDRQASWK